MKISLIQIHFICLSNNVFQLKFKLSINYLIQFTINKISINGIIKIITIVIQLLIPMLLMDLVVNYHQSALIKLHLNLLLRFNIGFWRMEIKKWRVGIRLTKRKGMEDWLNGRKAENNGILMRRTILIKYLNQPQSTLRK